MGRVPVKRILFYTNGQTNIRAVSFHIHTNNGNVKHRNLHTVVHKIFGCVMTIFSSPVRLIKQIVITIGVWPAPPCDLSHHSSILIRVFSTWTSTIVCMSPLVLHAMSDIYFFHFGIQLNWLKLWVNGIILHSTNYSIPICPTFPLNSEVFRFKSECRVKGLYNAVFNRFLYIIFWTNDWWEWNKVSRCKKNNTNWHCWIPYNHFITNALS
jgi:hypothetical protein